jgi:hypothetical protein
MSVFSDPESAHMVSMGVLCVVARIDGKVGVVATIALCNLIWLVLQTILLFLCLTSFLLPFRPTPQLKTGCLVLPPAGFGGLGPVALSLSAENLCCNICLH